MSDVLSWIRLPGPFLIGHRGFPEAARENTLPSFEAALEAGCDGVELDVRLTLDGVPVVHHDAELPGPEGPLVIEEESWLRLSEGRGAGRPGDYPLHRLDDVLAALSGRCLVNVEVKPVAPARLASAVRAVDAELDRVRPRESVLVSSFDPEVLAGLRHLDRGLLLGYLAASDRALGRLEDLEVVETLAALHPRHDLVAPNLMKRAAERGLAVHAWTVDDPAEAGRLLDLGVTSIITNRPPRVADAMFPAGGPE